MHHQPSPPHDLWRLSVGDVKYTMTAAFTTTMLAWGMLQFKSGYAKAGQTQWGMEEVKWGTDYLLKTVVGKPGNQTIVYQVTAH